MKAYAEKLKQLRVDRGLSQTQLAQVLAVDQRTISNWEKANREPNLEMLTKIAVFFEVSTDYLLGLSD